MINFDIPAIRSLLEPNNYRLIFVYLSFLNSINLSFLVLFTLIFRYDKEIIQVILITIRL